jgi:hypothetical protein
MDWAILHNPLNFDHKYPLDDKGMLSSKHKHLNPNFPSWCWPSANAQIAFSFPEEVHRWLSEHTWIVWWKPSDNNVCSSPVRDEISWTQVGKDTQIYSPKVLNREDPWANCPDLFRDFPTIPWSQSSTTRVSEKRGKLRFWTVSAGFRLADLPEELLFRIQRIILLSYYE